MNFTEKYEILELLTSGRVNTFLVRERTTREQAVVHSFECPASFSPESRNPAILKHFSALAPMPAESIMEIAFDENSSSAFVVTKVPVADALQSWICAYRSFVGGVADEPPPADSTSAFSQQKGTFGRPFGESEAFQNSACSLNLKSPAPAKATGAKEPGAFTREFLAITGKPQANADSATDVGLRPPAPTKNSTGAEAEKDGTGEFTSFFRGPFDQPHPTDKPIQYPDPAQTEPAPKAGEFTQMFGSEIRIDPKDPLGADPRNPELSKQPLSSTLTPGPLPAFSEIATPNLSAASRKPNIETVPSAENTFVGPSGRSGATEMFKQPRPDAPIVEPELPSGPSEFTMFLSRSQLQTNFPPEPPRPGALNSVAAPPPAAMPPMPAYAPPAPPPMPAPVLRPAAKVPSPLKPAPGGIVSYWPLITVLTVLFFLAAMLVMYFALKH